MKFKTSWHMAYPRQTHIDVIAENVAERRALAALKLATIVRPSHWTSEEMLLWTTPVLERVEDWVKAHPEAAAEEGAGVGRRHITYAWWTRVGKSWQTLRRKLDDHKRARVGSLRRQVPYRYMGELEGYRAAAKALGY